MQLSRHDGTVFSYAHTRRLRDKQRDASFSPHKNPADGTPGGEGGARLSSLSDNSPLSKQWSRPAGYNEDDTRGGR